MRLIQIFKTKKLFLLNIFLTLYVAINLVGGEIGLISYFKKKNVFHRPWGKYTNLFNGKGFLIKELVINSKSSISLLYPTTTGYSIYENRV